MVMDNARVTELTEQLRQLDNERRSMENEIVELCDILNQPGMPGMKGKLTDSEGFPRADIDLHQV